MPRRTAPWAAFAPLLGAGGRSSAATPVRADLRHYDPAIHTLWAWLGEHEEAVAANLLEPGPAPADLVQRLWAIHPDLSVTVGPGRTAPMHLAITGDGGVALRLLTGRIVARRHHALTHLEVVGARQRARVLAGQQVRLGGRVFRLDAFQAEARVDAAAEVLDVVVQHPGLRAAPPAAREAGLMLLLDTVLGEDDVRMWIRRAGLAEGPLTGNTLTAQALRQQVDRLKDVATRDQWALLERPPHDGQPAQVLLANRALKRLHHPRFGLRLQVTVVLADPGEDGLLRPHERRTLDRLESDLDHAVGRDGVKTGVRTVDGQHRITWFVDAAAPVEERVDAVLQPLHWTVSVRTALDLEWTERV